jgi:hypothetical protein
MEIRERLRFLALNVNDWITAVTRSDELHAEYWRGEGAEPGSMSWDMIEENMEDIEWARYLTWCAFTRLEREDLEEMGAE